MVNCRKGINTINHLRIGGEVCEGDEEIRDKVLEFYSLYSEERERRPNVDGFSLPHISNFQADWLGRPFDVDEVKKAVWEMEGDKAPDPNNFHFYISC